MEKPTLALILITLLLLCAGQILFRYAAMGITIKDPWTFFTFPVFLALVIYGLATICWMIVLSKVPLSTAVPFYGLMFILVPIAAWVILKEPFTFRTILGGVIILIGVIVSTS